MKITTYLKIFLTILVFTSISSIKLQGQENYSLNDFTIKSTNIQNAGMLILGGWAISNITSGAEGWAHESGVRKYFNQMNFLWNTVNLGIAGFALWNSNKKPDNQSGTDNLKQHLTAEKTLLVNAAILDIAYIATGLYLKNLANLTNNNAEMLSGYGNALIMQGSFLFVLDSFIYSTLRIHRSNFNKAINISFTGNSIKFKYNINNLI